MIVMFLLMFLPSPAQATVDVRNGNFYKQIIDFPMSHPGFPGVALQYNSQNSEVGLFGKGWCSNLEKKIQERANGQLVYYPCGLGNKVVFRKGKKTPHKFFAAEYGLARRIEKKGQEGFVLHLPYGTEEFNSAGQLTKITTPQHLPVTFQYHKNGLHRVNLGNNRNLQLKVNKSRIHEIANSGSNSKTQYIFSKGHPLLVGIKTADKRQFQFDYEKSRQRLEKVVFNGKYLGGVTYANHRVSQFINAKGCRENYSYSNSESGANRINRTDIQKICKNQKPIARFYEVWKTKKGAKNAKMVSNLSGTKVEIQFDGKGKPKQIARAQFTSQFSTLKTGFVETRTFKDGSKKTFNFNQQRRLVLYKREIPRVRPQQIVYKYQSGKLHKVESSNGMRFALKYDKNQQLSEIRKIGQGTLVLKNGAKKLSSKLISDNFQIYSDFLTLINPT